MQKKSWIYTAQQINYILFFLQANIKRDENENEKISFYLFIAFIYIS